MKSHASLYLNQILYNYLQLKLKSWTIFLNMALISRMTDFVHLNDYILMANFKLLMCSILNVLKVLTDNLFMKSQTEYIWSSVLSLNLVTESRFSNLV